MGKPWENHRKTTGKPQENDGLVEFDGIYPPMSSVTWLVRVEIHWIHWGEQNMNIIELNSVFFQHAMFESRRVYDTKSDHLIDHSKCHFIWFDISENHLIYA